jgi:hypothetical protein
MKKEHLVLLLVNLALLAGFSINFIARQNYEFIIYICVILFFLGLIGFTRKKVDYSLCALIVLTIWAALHLAGGGLSVGGERLYDVILIPLSQTWPVFRYDQFVHIWGFGAATLVMFDVLNPALAQTDTRPVATGIVLVMAGLGIGALNEIVEFIVSLLVPGSGVGGYINTALDLCADLIGALLALLYLHCRSFCVQRNRMHSSAI